VFDWLRTRLNRLKARIPRLGATRFVRARYDAAATNPDNYRHWANADSLSADAANNPEVRRVLRNRSRYEVANNSYARGIVLTLANDVVGTGPRGRRRSAGRLPQAHHSDAVGRLSRSHWHFRTVWNDPFPAPS
jgi:hypothetical protein